MPSTYLLFQKLVPRVIALASVAFGALAVIPQAQAAVMQVSPVRIDFEPVQSAQALLVFNNGQRDLEAQVRIMQWSQQNGENRLVPASDIVASPAIMRVSPGKRQTVRLIRLQPAAPARELSYRVILDELPRKDAASNHVNVLLRYSIPLFIEPHEQAMQAPAQEDPAVAATTDLSHVRSQVVRGQDGRAQLRMSNNGDHVLRISSISTLASGGQSRVLVNGLVGYVLPGSQMSWPLNTAYPLSPGVTLKARFNDNREAQAVPLGESGR